jgi:hypothetical protein
MDLSDLLAIPLTAAAIVAGTILGMANSPGVPTLLTWLHELLLRLGLAGAAAISVLLLGWLSAAPDGGLLATIPVSLLLLEAGRALAGPALGSLDD